MFLIYSPASSVSGCSVVVDSAVTLRNSFERSSKRYSTVAALVCNTIHDESQRVRTPLACTIVHNASETKEAQRHTTSTCITLYHTQPLKLQLLCILSSSVYNPPAGSADENLGHLIQQAHVQFLVSTKSSNFSVIDDLCCITFQGIPFEF